MSHSLTKPFKRRQAANRHGADEKQRTRHRHAPQEPAQRFDVARPGRVHHGSRRLEEQPFEQAVVQRVQERARESSERDVRGARLALAEYPDAQAER